MEITPPAQTPEFPALPDGKEGKQVIIRIAKSQATTTRRQLMQPGQTKFQADPESPNRLRALVQPQSQRHSLLTLKAKCQTIKSPRTSITHLKEPGRKESMRDYTSTSTPDRTRSLHASIRTSLTAKTTLKTTRKTCTWPGLTPSKLPLVPPCQNDGGKKC